MTGRHAASRRLAAVVLGGLVLAATAVSCANEEGSRSTERPGGLLDPPQVAGAEPPASDSDAVRVTRVGSFPVMATAMASVPGSDEFLVADRRGVIRRLVRVERDGVVAPELESGVVADFSEQVSLQFDRGFLAMALVDGGTSLVTLSTDPTGASTLQQYPYTPGEPLDTTEPRVLWHMPWAYPWHHGGGMALTADGDLLVGVGDKGVTLPGTPASQDPTLFLGGIVRIPAATLADRTAPWSPDPAEMIARGLRNPWRVAIDQRGGDVWIGDVGDLVSEEIDRIPAAEVDADLNFGYPYYEGSHERSVRIPTDVDFREATVERAHGNGVCGIVVGPVYRGEALGGLDGRLLYGDLCSTEVHALRIDADGAVVSDEVVGDLSDTPVSFGVDGAGEVYALTAQGMVLRLDPEAWRVPDPDLRPVGVSPTTAPFREPDLDCGIGQALEPLSFLNGLGPVELEQTFERATAGLEVGLPKLPPELVEAGATIDRVIGFMHDLYASVDWNAASPSLSYIRQELLDASGPFEGFPDAIAAFSGSRCT